MKNKISCIGTGLLYFYVHFVTEFVCFFVLARYVESPPLMWIIVIAYDMLAFVPQGIIGYISDYYDRIPFGIIGLALLALSLCLQRFVPSAFISLVPLCLGNAFVHINGAEVTIKTSEGKLSHSAIFVSGGSFGVVCGKLLGKTDFPFWLLLILIASAVPFVILAQMLLKRKSEHTDLKQYFNYNNTKIPVLLTVILTVFIVAVRGYMAYGIPTSWNKSVLQTVLLFVFMGIGKALGGILSDLFGIKKTAILSVMFALPFLLFGDNNMSVSLIGVLFFSMTMSVTLAVLVSALPKTPGLAFGLTTIGLFFGCVPVSFFKINSFAVNCIILTVLTAVCIVCFMAVLRKDGKYGKCHSNSK